MRVLLTGMSGAGKSTITAELAARGYGAVDLDTPEWSEWVNADPADVLAPGDGKDWVWRLDRVRSLLRDHHHTQMLFVSGAASNMTSLYSLFDQIILLSAPLPVIIKRLGDREAGSYGSTDQERAKVAELTAMIEPLLRRLAHHEIDTSGSIDAAVDQILRLARGPAE